MSSSIKEPTLPAPAGLDKPSLNKSKARRFQKQFLVLLALSAVSLSFSSSVLSSSFFSESSSTTIPSAIHVQNLLSRCAELQSKPGVPPNFYSRTESDRFVKGTRPVLIQNATIWSGKNDGHEIVKGDIVLNAGIIQWVGGQFSEEERVKMTLDDILVVDANGAYVTPGLIDLHSHLGVDSSPSLSGSADTNSHKALALPWLRSLDGLNTHDDAYRLTVSGGVTSVNVLPGSANAIGGQAFPIKLRSTSDRSSSSLLVEVLGSSNSTGWRQLKQACGENPSRVHDGTRMDTIWGFREAYNKARSLVQKQDKFCSAVAQKDWKSPAIKDAEGEFPEDLQWEALADVIRGKVKIHNHCYEAVDLDGIVRLTNEFEFPIAAFHHAHETYLVPNLLKKAWGSTPAVAIFAINGRYKREAFRGSEYAPRVLADNGIRVVIKSDHPVMNSRYLLFDAQQAHYYGLPENLALASVTTTPAGVLGLDHRIGYLQPGYDADVVIWDSHPLALGATPKQVYIDGIPQLEEPHAAIKPSSSQIVPTVPNFDQEREAALKYDGLPPLTPAKEAKNVIFENVASVFIQNAATGFVEEKFQGPSYGVAVVKNGKIFCTGSRATCLTPETPAPYEVVNLNGGVLAPSLTTFGSNLGMSEIDAEQSTQDGEIFDPLSRDIPSVAGGDGLVIQAVDGLVYSTRNALHAYRAGVTRAIAIPSSSSVFIGYGSYISTGSTHKLAKGAVLQDRTAFHVRITPNPRNSASVSTQIGVLRRQLLGLGKGDMKEAFEDILKGQTTLVVHAESADIISSIIKLKAEIEQNERTHLKVTIVGALEAHLVAAELSRAAIGVILNPARPFPYSWQQRRILPGVPLSSENAIAVLIKHNVTVGLGILEGWEARNARLDAAWIALETPTLSDSSTLALVSTNVEKLLGVSVSSVRENEVVAYSGGGVFGFESKVVAVISPVKETIDLF